MASSNFSDDSTDALIASRLPAWLSATSLDNLYGLHESQRRQQLLQQQLHDLLANIATADAFAEPLLRHELQAQLALTLDVRRAKLRRKALLRFPSYISHIPDGIKEQVYEHSLLQAAMHNFTEAEASNSTIMPGTMLLDERGQRCTLRPSRFYSLCRALDVGGQYQSYLRAQLTPGGEAGSRIETLFERSIRANLEAALRLSLANGEITGRAQGHCTPLVALCATDASLLPGVKPRQLRVFGLQVRGAVAFELSDQAATGEGGEGILCWIPDDPSGPLTWYTSWGQLFLTLGKQFRLPGYVDFFQRFIGEHDREAYMQALSKALSGTALDAPVPLDGRREPIVQPLFAYLRKLHIDTLLENGRVHAVPTAQVDARLRDRRLHFYLSVALDALSLASFALPVLALPLLGISALQVADEVYEGYADWQLGNRQGALQHLYAVAEAVAMTAVNVGAGAATQRLARAAHVEQLVPVHTADGELKLCDPALPGYAVEHRGKVAELLDTAQGEYLRTPAASYLTYLDAETQQRRIRHPQRADAHAPLIEDNGAGGWRHELESPLQWQDRLELLQGLQRDWAQLDAQTAENVLHATGFTDGQLRRLHLDQQPPPARLRDAVQRYQLHAQAPELSGEDFEQYLQAQQPAASAAEALLRRDFPGLSGNGARELVEQASEASLEQMQARQRVPLDMAEHAHWYLRDTRLDRACAGLLQPAALNRDTEQLALGLIADRAPWRNVRIELRTAPPSGEMIAWAGVRDASKVRTVVRGERGYLALDANGQPLPLAQAGDTLFEALMLQLDPWQKSALGNAGQSPEALSRAMAQWAAGQRDRVATLLGMAPVGLGFRPPLRLGDGRLGYPLSGRGESSNSALRRGMQLLFAQGDDLVDEFVANARRQGVLPWNRFLNLCEQLRALDRALGQWRRQASGPIQLIRRIRMARRIRRAWQRQAAGEHGEYSLDLAGFRLGALPALPESVSFAHITTLNLRDMNLTAAADSFLARFPNVQRLDLSQNRLTMIPQTPHMTRLQQVDLRNNQIVEVTEAQAQALRLSPDRVRLQGNPLSAAALERLAAQAPPVAELPPQAGDPWFEDMNQQFVEQCRIEWQSLRQDADSVGFFVFLEELRNGEAYAHDPADIRRQVNELLWAMYRHTLVRETLFQMTTMPRRITTLDEVVVGLKVALRTGGLRGRRLERELRDLGREQFRLDQLNRIAARHIENLRASGQHVNDNEVYLALRTRLAEPLGLYGQPRYLDFEHVSSVTSEDLVAAEAAVYEAESAEQLSQFLAQQRFWQDHVRLAYADQFAGLTGADAAERSAAEQALTLSLARGNSWAWYRLQPPHGPGSRAFAHLSRRLEESLQLWRGQEGDPEHVGRTHLANVLRNLWQSQYRGGGESADTEMGGQAISSLPRLAPGIMFDRLNSFTLCNQQLRRVDADFLSRFPNMTVLDLSGNRLATLDGLEHLPRLQRLRLGGNQLSTVEGLEQLGQLVELDMSGNDLSEVPAAVERLTQLSSLDLSFNQLTRLEERLMQLVSLENLQLSGNLLGDLPRGLVRLVRLRTLNLSGNRLSTIPHGLNQLGRLVELYLHDNQITLDVESQPRLEWFSSLQVLTLGRNPLGALPQLRFNVHLQYLSLRDSGLRNFPLGLLQSHPQLAVDLRGNRIETLSEQALAWVEAHPQYVNLEHNRLNEAILLRIRQAVVRQQQEQARAEQEQEPQLTLRAPGRRA
ncbi:NEL-type E3 ubiquitin ligase domain-containing protein [Pseudomonas sp. NPDC089408]|uniref:NEL-type E3 ubiquitin ligase domain-containing protein n=1 Tax=Pseudomonas sp. NPDC089408 TaxID=3364465 RepID=UPI0037F29FCC